MEQQTSKHLEIETYPANIKTLPLDTRLAKQFKRQGQFNVNLPVFLMRGLVHLATRSFSFRFYRKGIKTSYKKIQLPDRSVGLTIVSPPNGTDLPVILYFHGGGGLLADSSSYIHVLKNLCSCVNAIVIGVDYNRAPEFKFPVPLYDCYEALKWTFDHAEDFGANKDHIILAGDSAGGNLAAGLSLYTRDNKGPKILQQLLINPRTDHSSNTESFIAFREGYGLSEEAMKFFEHHYFSTPSDSKDVYASPLQHGYLGNLPKTIIVTSEYDPLRDEGENYGFKLREAGVKVEIIRYLGMAHTMVAFGATKESAQHFYNWIEGKIE